MKVKDIAILRNLQLLSYISKELEVQTHIKKNKLLGHPIISWYIERILRNLQSPMTQNEFKEFMNVSNKLDYVIANYDKDSKDYLNSNVRIIFKSQIYKKLFISDYIYPNNVFVQELESETEINNCILKLNNSIDLLKKVSPTYHKKMVNSINDIYVVKTNDETVEVSSSPNFNFGCFNICVTDIVNVTESIIHEMHHNILESNNLIYLFFENSKENKYSSPWRPDIRPVNGIFHAIYVFFHICLFYSRAISTH